MLEINPVDKKTGNENVRYSGSLTVVEKISDKNFIVRTLKDGKPGTQEFTVFSKNNLSPGDIIKGTIISRGISRENSLFLSVLKNQNNNFFSHAEKSNIIEKNDILARFLASFLDSTGKKADNLLLSILESLISKKKIMNNYYAALAGEAYLKGFRNEAAISAFLAAISPDHDKNQGKKHGKKEKKEEIKEILSEAVSNSEKEDNPLFLFNHSPLSDRNWIIIPFKIDDINGDIRLKTISNSLKNLVIHVEKGVYKWFFELSDLEAAAPELSGHAAELETQALLYDVHVAAPGRSIHAAEPEKLAKIYANKEGIFACQGKNFNLFKKKLQNLGVIIDDNIYDIEMFNGFSKSNASYDVDLRI